MSWEMFVSLLYKKLKMGIKRRRVSIVGVQLWNNVKEDVRMVNSFLVFKMIIYKTIFECYK